MTEALDDAGRAASAWFEGLTVPAGWEPVAVLARGVWERREAVGDDVMAAVLDAAPEYRDLVPLDDLRQSVDENIEMMLRGLAERRAADEDEVAVRRAVGRRRAMQGMSTETLISGFLAGYQAMWQALVNAVPEDDAESARLLSSGALVFWGWVHDVTDALAETHAATLRAQEARLVSARSRLVELVEAGDVTSDEVRRVASAAGFAEDGKWRGAVASVVRVDGDEARRLQLALDERDGVHAVAGRGERLLVFSQGLGLGDVVEVIGAVLGDSAAGVGLERTGIGGARQSLLDAELALTVSAPGEVVAFEEDWLWATLTSASERLSPLLAAGSDVASEHPHLAETVVAFSESGFSVTEAARQLDLHANSVAYRLERWRSLTGWDPRTFAGLARSLAAIRAGAAGGA